jgi:hypothetical protein
MSKFVQAALWALPFVLVGLAIAHAFSDAPPPVRQVSYLAG